MSVLGTLLTATREDNALVRALKKKIGGWLEQDRPQRQREGEAGTIRSSNAAYVSLIRSMWRLALGRDEVDLFNWDWHSEEREVDTEARGPDHLLDHQGSSG